MTEAIVDPFEAIEVNIDQMNGCLLALGSGKAALQPILEIASVGEACERVVNGGFLEFCSLPVEPNNRSTQESCRGYNEHHEETGCQRGGLVQPKNILSGPLA
jgi:hypothetical protein